MLFSVHRIKESGEVQLSFSWLLLERDSRKGDRRNFCKNFNAVLPNCQESLGIDYEEEHLYSPVTVIGWGSTEHLQYTASDKAGRAYPGNDVAGFLVGLYLSCLKDGHLYFMVFLPDPLGGMSSSEVAAVLLRPVDVVGHIWTTLLEVRRAKTRQRWRT